MDLLARRKVQAFGWLEAAILCAYTVLVGWLTWVHEPWADEAQSWLIARDSSLGEIFFKRLHYEGTPGLWHLFLWVCSRLHISYAGMHWATALIGVGTVYLVLRHSPFPAVVRLLLPFSFALVYQTSIIARSYSLMPILVVPICIEITSGRRRPFLFALLIGLLANTALIGFFLALSLTPFYLLRPDVRTRSFEPKLLWKPAALLAGLLLFAIYTAVPAPDCEFGRAVGLSSDPAMAKLLSVLTRIPVPPPSAVPVGRVAGEPSSTPSLRYAYQRLLWELYRRFAHRPHGGAFVRAGFSLTSIAFFAVSSSNLLALLFYGAMLSWLWRHRVLRYFLPPGVTIGAGYVLGFTEHHTSAIWAALIATLWLVWAGVLPGERTKLDTSFVLLLAVVLLEQIAWTGFATVYDTKDAFDGSVAAAKFLMPLDGRSTLFGYTFESVSEEPYADHPLYGNQSSTYWPWSSTVDVDREIALTLQQHPAYVLATEESEGDVLWPNQILPLAVPESKADIRGYLLAHGYRETHRFCGKQPAHLGFSVKICEFIYEPVPADKQIRWLKAN